MPECSGLVCPDGSRKVQTGFGGGLAQCECRSTVSPTTKQKTINTGGGKSLTEMINDAFIKPITNFVSNLFPSVKPANEPSVTIGTKTNQTPVPFWTESGITGRLGTGDPPPDFFGDSGITGKLGTGDYFDSTTGTVVATNVNKRGGTHNPSPEKSVSIFGQNISIPQNLMIPIGIAAVIIVIILLRRIL